MDCLNKRNESFNFFKKVGKKIYYKKNSILFFEEETPEKMYFLVKGQIRLIKYYQNEEKIIDRFNDMSLIGISCLMEPYWKFTAVTDTKCEIIECTKEHFMTFSINNPSFIISILLNRIQHLRNFTLDYHYSHSEKIAKFINSNYKTNLKISIQELSKNFGCRAETVSRILKKMERDNIIVKKGRYIKEIDKEKLSDIYEV